MNKKQRWLINIVQEELQAYEAFLLEIVSYNMKVTNAQLEKLLGKLNITKSL